MIIKYSKKTGKLIIKVDMTRKGKLSGKGKSYIVDGTNFFKQLEEISPSLKGFSLNLVVIRKKDKKPIKIATEE